MRKSGFERIERSWVWWAVLFFWLALFLWWFN